MSNPKYLLTCQRCGEEFPARSVKEKYCKKCREAIKGDNPVETTEEYIRHRVRDPEQFHKGSFRTISLGDGIKAVIGCPKSATYSSGKCQDGTQIQTLLFDKTKYTEESARKWVKNHPKVKARKK